MRSIHPMLAAVAIVCLSDCIADRVRAQDTGGVRIVAVDAGSPAPFAGMLLPDDELIRWRREIERLRIELDLMRMRAEAMRDADAELRRALDATAADRLALRDQSWGARVASITAERDRARALQGPRWWQRGALWLPVGFVLGVAGVATTLVLSR